MIRYKQFPLETVLKNRTLRNLLPMGFDEAANIFQISANALRVLSGIFLALVLGSVIRLLAVQRASPDKAKSRIQSLKSWWVMFLVLTLAIMLGRLGCIALMAILSYLGLREYLSFLPSQRSRWHLDFWAYIALVLNYLWIYLDLFDVFVAFIPVGVFLFLPMRMVLTGNTQGYLRNVTGLFWGLMLTVFGISHAAYLLVLPNTVNPVANGVGLFVYLVVLTETNDIAQALWGRRFGVHKLTPGVSPNKTWEGFIGGLVVTLVLALVLAPLLTPFGQAVQLGWDTHMLTIPYLWAFVAGFIIALGGFMGDISMSAVKRDARIKDSGTIVPGQGGILDRIDSLTFTAPLFFYFVYFLHYK